MILTGRKKLIAPYEYADETNIGNIIALIQPVFQVNVGEMNYLIQYYKGNQIILNRTKKYRQEINNKIVENHANEITTFKTGYLLNKPIQYVARKESVDNKSVELLNDYMIVDNKDGKDKKLANEQSICGTAYRLVLPNNNYVDDGNSSPFNIYDIDPRQGFVVYSSGLGEKPILGGVIYAIKGKNDLMNYIVECYTETKFYKLINGVLIETKDNPVGMIPVIEYPLNEERIGDFEKVIGLLDAINLVQSNRLDGVEQFIQSLLVFKNVDIDENGFLALKEQGAIKIKDNGSGDKKVEANVQFLTQELNQTQVQTLKDDMYNIVLKICGMPNRNTNSKSTSDTGSAVIMRDGWSEAEARATETEMSFKSSEREVLKLCLRIARDITKNKLNLTLSDLDIRFTRRNYENIYQKAQVLQLLLSTNKVAPRLAFTICGLFSNSEEAYNESVEYFKNNPVEVVENKVEETKTDEDNANKQ